MMIEKEVGSDKGSIENRHFGIGLRLAESPPILKDYKISRQAIFNSLRERDNFVFFLHPGRSSTRFARHEKNTNFHENANFT